MLFPSFEKKDKAEIERRVSEVLKMVQLAGFEKRSIQNYPVVNAMGSDCPGYYQWTTSGPLDEPLSALDLKLRTDMQYELRNCKQRLGITFVFVTHDQEEALPWVTGSLSWMKR